MKPRPTPRPPMARRVPRRLPPRRILPARAASSNQEVDDYDAETEPSMKLSHAFIVVLLLHVLAVGGVFAFNTIKAKPSRTEAAASKTAERPEPKVETTRVEPAAKAPAAPVAAAPAAAPSAAPAGDTHTVVAGETLTRIASIHKTTVEALEKANGLTSGATIRVGQVLQLPGTTSKPVIAKTGTPAAAPTPVVISTPAVSAAKAPEAKPVAKAPETKPAAKAPETPAAAAPAAASTAASSSTYVVAKGDNPYSIAKKLKVSYTELLKVNKIEDPTKLQIGQKLIVP